MSSEFDRDLVKCAEVIVKIGLNLQPGQRLVIGTPTYFYFLDGVPIHLAPLIRVITATAFKAGGNHSLTHVDFTAGSGTRISTGSPATAWPSL